MVKVIKVLLLTIMCVLVSKSFSQETTENDNNAIISRNASWLYYDSIMPDNEPWFSEFNKTLGWKTGYAEFGYGDGDETTEIGYNDDEDNKYITSYYYKSFSIADPKAYIGYLVSIVVDDGALVYLNGNEIWRFNLPEGEITGGTRSIPLISKAAEDIAHVFVPESEYHEYWCENVRQDNCNFIRV